MTGKKGHERTTIEEKVNKNENHKRKKEQKANILFAGGAVSSVC